MDDNHGLFYFNFRNDNFDKNNFNSDIHIKEINNNFGFSLLNTIRNKNDKLYVKEIRMLSDYIFKLIKSKTNGHLSPKDEPTINYMLQLIIDSNKYDTFNSVYDCIFDLNFRKNIIKNSSNKLDLPDIVDRIELKPDAPVIKALFELKNIDSIISNTNSSINFKKTIKNSNKYIFNFDKISPNYIYDISTLILNKLYLELELQPNNKDNRFISCLDTIDNFQHLKLLENHYRHSRHCKAGIINIFEYTSNLPISIFNNNYINIIFKNNDINDSERISNITDINKTRIQNIKNYHFILNKSNNIYPIQI